MRLTFQATIYSVEKWAYHNMEMPPVDGLEITPGMRNAKDTLHGLIVGAYGSECRFPKGYGEFRILEVSDFMPFVKINDWVRNTARELGLATIPAELPDLVEQRVA